MLDGLARQYYRFTLYPSQEMKNEYRRLGKFKDSEFAFQTSRGVDGEQASTVAYEPRENPARCRHSAWTDCFRGGVRHWIFTIPTAQLIGDQGCLVAMDVSSGFIERVSKKVQAADLKNIRVVKRDALDTGLDTASIDKVLLFGVIPFPLLPLNRLLPEMHRVLKPEGTLVVWLFPPVVHFWVPKSILRSGLFTYMNKRNGVYNYKRC